MPEDRFEKTSGRLCQRAEPVNHYSPRMMSAPDENTGLSKVCNKWSAPGRPNYNADVSRQYSRCVSNNLVNERRYLYSSVEVINLDSVSEIREQRFM